MQEETYGKLRKETKKKREKGEPKKRKRELGYGRTEREVRVRKNLEH